MLEITTSCCGTTFSAPERYEQYVGTGTTYDCPECGALQVMMGKVTAFTSKNFHEWMHEKDSNWPKDGANTGFVEIGR